LTKFFISWKIVRKEIFDDFVESTMEPYFKPKMLKSISYYLSKSFRFYDIKRDYVAPLFFILILVVNFISYYLFSSGPYNLDLTKPDSIDNFRRISSKVVLVFFITNIIVNLAASGYMYAYIRELRDRIYTLRECITTTVKNSIKITFAYLIASIYIPAYVVSLKLPGVWFFVAMGILLLTAVLFFFIYLIFIFSNNYIQDKNSSLPDSLKASSKLAKGHKIEIFSVILIVKFISLMLMFFTLSFVSSPGNGLIQMFVESFLGAIISLVNVRVVTLMYFDLEYSSL
jgi:hypothetical protein